MFIVYIFIYAVYICCYCLFIINVYISKDYITIYCFVLLFDPDPGHFSDRTQNDPFVRVTYPYKQTLLMNSSKLLWHICRNIKTIIILFVYLYR